MYIHSIIPFANKTLLQAAILFYIIVVMNIYSTCMYLILPQNKGKNFIQQ